MYVCEIDAGEKIDFQCHKKRALYVKVMEGSGRINGRFSQSGDAVEIKEEDLKVKAIDRVHILLVEVADPF